MIGEHPGPLTYDLLTRTNYTLRDLGDRLPWDESAWFVEGLFQDPSSHLAAAAQRWKFPVSQEWMLLAQQLDDFRAANAKSPKPLARPWDGAPTFRRMTPEQKARLQLMAGRGGGDDGG